MNGLEITDRGKETFEMEVERSLRDFDSEMSYYVLLYYISDIDVCSVIFCVALLCLSENPPVINFFA